jgi:hypothetical protein
MNIAVLMLSMLVWINAQLGTTVSELPRVEYRSSQVLFNMLYPNVEYEEKHKDEVLGIYLPDLILLDEDFDSTDLWQQSILLHELVHHVQEFAGIEFDCLPHYEKQAILAQQDWLAGVGINIWDHLDPLYTIARITCYMPDQAR